MVKQNKKIKGSLKAKRKRRKDIASLPVEEKFEILIQLQKITSSILQSRGIERQPWGETTKVFQVREQNVTGFQHAIPVDLLADTDWSKDCFLVR